jgi:hypothetical protein
MWHGDRDLPLGGRVLAPRRAAPPPEVLSCRRAPRRQGLNAVGYGGRNLPSWGMAPDVYFSNFLIRPFIFRKSRQNKYKKIPVTKKMICETWLALLL